MQHLENGGEVGRSQELQQSRSISVRDGESVSDASAVIRHRFSEATGHTADVRMRQSSVEACAPVADAQIFDTMDLMHGIAWSCLPNGAACLFSRYFRDYVGLQTDQLQNVDWLTTIHPNDVSACIRHWQASVRGRRSLEIDARMRRYDGEYRWFMLRVMPRFGPGGSVVRWVGVGTDIEERKRAEARARRGEALLEDAHQLADLGVFSWRPGSDVMTCSKRLHEMLGIDACLSVTRSVIKERTHPDDTPLFFGRLHQEQPTFSRFTDKTRILMADGTVRHIEYCAYPTTSASDELAYYGTVQDVTEQHLASEALIEARAKLAQAARASSLGVLTASITHEINQPLSGILTNTNTCLRMLSGHPLNVEGAIETVKRTIRDARRAAAIISRLRDLFNHKAVQATSWGLCAATREVIELVQGELQRNRIVLRHLYDDDRHLVDGDRIQIQQVIMNLIRNAIDAINVESEGPRIMVVEVVFKMNQAELTVRDSGVGLDGIDTSSLFDPFFTTKKEGMGIGLSVSKAIIEAHGGELWAKANIRRGATFGFSIPKKCLIDFA